MNDKLTIEAPNFESRGTTFVKKAVKDYFINGLGGLTLIFEDGTEFVFYGE